MTLKLLCASLTHWHVCNKWVSVWLNTVLALLEDLANRRLMWTYLQGPRGLSDLWWWMANKPIEIILDICVKLGTTLKRSTQRNRSVPLVQLMTTSLHALKQLGQHELADRSWISQPSFSAILPAVWDCIIEMTPCYKKFSYSVSRPTSKFGAISSFPNVIRVIDLWQSSPPTEWGNFPSPVPVHYIGRNYYY